MSQLRELAQGARDVSRGALALVRQNAKVLVLLAAALVFVWLLGEVASGEIMRLDTLAYEVVVEGLRSDAVTPVMEAFTSLASLVVLAVMAAVIAALAPGKAPGWCVTVNLVCVVILNHGGPERYFYTLFRVMETIVGIVVAVGINHLLPDRRKDAGETE